MKDIRIKQMELNNFKCHDHLVLNFYGSDASIYGDNGTGKTSVYDALTWLLFGRDSAGNGEKNIEIKPLSENGEVRDHMAITEVEVILLVNGEELTLKRTYQEIWSTKRGSGEATYDGNTSEYYIDGVTGKKMAFTEKVNELVDEETFKLLTSVSYFASDISWQDRRAILFEIANVVPDSEIMKQDARFAALLEKTEKLSVEDLKKKLISDKKGLVGAKNELPARISECQKTIEDIKDIDFKAAETELREAEAACNSINAQILAIEHDTAIENKRIEVKEAKLELAALENENRAYHASQRATMPDIEGMRKTLSTLQRQHISKKNSAAATESLIANYDREIATSRERWIAVNSESFTGGNCPTCGQALPAQQMQSAKDKFETWKSDRLREIEATANAKKEAKKQQVERLQEISEEIAKIESEITAAAGRITVAEGYVTATEDMKDYSKRKQTISERIAFFEGELADMVSNCSTVKAELESKRQLLEADAKRARDIVSRESLLNYSRDRIKALEEDAKRTALLLDSIEEMLYLIDEYTRYKTTFIEESINSMFSLAKFRLFREQANGGIEDRCDVVFEGVPYINVNNSMKINLGIDIINTLSRAYGVTVPLFVDNAESVTNLEKSDCQVIRLVVSENDKILRCEI